MQRLAQFVTKHPWFILIVATFITVFMIGGLTQVTMTTDIKSFFPQDDPRVVTYNRIDEQFGGAETIMVAYAAEHLFHAEHLQTLADLTAQLQRVPGISSVLSLANASHMTLSDFGIEMLPLVTDMPATLAEADVLRDTILADDFYRGMIVSDDGTTALIALQLEYGSDRTVVVNGVQAVLDNVPANDARLYMTGTPVLNEVLITSMQADLRRLIPLVLAILAAVLYAYFRTGRGVLLAFLTVGMSLVWTIGLMGYLGKHLSPLSAVMPVVLISLGNAYAIYIITRHDEETANYDAKTAAARTLKYVGIAVVMAGTTTVAGFLSNAGSDITLMREFGLFTAFGIMSALLVSITAVPALLTVLPVKPAAKTKRTKRVSLLDRLLRQFAHVSLNRPGAVLAVAAIVIVMSVGGMTRLTSDSNFFNFFDPQSEARQAYDMVKKKFGGSETVEVAITGDLTDPDLLRAMQSVSHDMAALPDLTRPISAVDVVQRIDGAIMGTDAGMIPHESDHVAQYYLLAEMDENDLLSRFVNMDYSQGRIQARTGDTSPQGVSEMTATLQRAIDDHMPPTAEATVTGMVVLLDALSEMLVKSQITSLLLSFLTVFIIVRLLLRSWEGSLLAVGVVATVTLANFGLMGWAGISLDIVTVLISSIGVGVGVDFSIHIYSRYQEELAQRTKASALDGPVLPTRPMAAAEHEQGPVNGEDTAAPPEEVRLNTDGWYDAMHMAITATGRAVATNAGGIIAGFIVLASSSFPPLRYFGVLVTFSMAMAALGALVLLPAVMSRRQQRVTARLGETKSI